MEQLKKGKKKLVVMIVLAVLAVIFLAGTLVMAVKGSGTAWRVESLVSEKEIKAAHEQELKDEDEDGNKTAGILLTPVQEKITLSARDAKVESDETKSDITGIDADYVLPNSSTDYLTDADVSGLSKDELRIARNEILARHGRIFESGDLKNYFEGKSWYQGTIEAKKFDADMDNLISDCEKANIELIKSYE